MVKEFVEGWDIVQTLGEGAYGEVLLVVNRQTKEPVAVKSIGLKGRSNAIMGIIRKEVYVHRLLKHENIIKFKGHRHEPHVHFIFLEYACGGELFDRIEPDYGMPQVQAHKYFSQLIAGVEYLHSLGVAHRDLKPENVLLDANDNVKISDFGLATLFRHKGKERNLTKRCGTIPYVSPEVYTRAYRAEPADIWSCGIILVAMLAGELPWDKPTMECPEFVKWKESDTSSPPWSKISTVALALLKKILSPNPDMRYTIPKIKNHIWFKKTNIVKGVEKWDGDNIAYKRQCSLLSFVRRGENVILSCSQPEPMVKNENDVVDIHSNSIDVLTHGICFSQPAHPEDMMLCSQTTLSQEDNSRLPVEKVVVRRMTRFCIKMNAESAAEELKLALDKLGYSWKKFAPGQVLVNTVDRRKTNLVFKATLIEMGDNILFDFRLSRGDGLEFKRHFLKIRNFMSHMIVKGPIIWPMMAKGIV